MTARRHAWAAVPAAAALPQAALYLAHPHLAAGDTGVRLAIGSVVGAAAGGFLLSHHFGLPGLAGVLRSALAFPPAVMAGGAIGGAIAFGGLGLLAGPAFAFGIAGTSFFPAFLASAAAMHLAGAWRRRLDPPAPPRFAWLLAWWLAGAAYAAVFGLPPFAA